MSNVSQIIKSIPWIILDILGYMAGDAMSPCKSVKPSCKVLLAKFAMSCWALLRSIKDVSAFFKLTSWPQNVKT